MKKWSEKIAVLFAFIVGSYGSAAWAANGVWIGTADGNWSDPANWKDGIYASGAGSTAYFTNGASVTVQQDLGSLTVGSLYFANATVTITNNTIALSAGTSAITVNGGAVTANVNVALAPVSGVTLTKEGTGTLVLNKPAGNMVPFSGLAINGGSILLGANVGGDGLGVGSGTITINAGTTLRYLSNNLINNYAILDVKNGGVLDFKGVSDNIGAITGDGIVTNYTWQAQFWLNGTTRKFSGQIFGGGTMQFMQPGVFVSGASNTLQNVTFRMDYPNILAFAPNVGTYYVGLLTTTNKQTLALQDTAGEPITLALGSRNDNFSLAPDLTGNGGLTKAGTGTMTVTNVQAYSGQTAVIGGTFKLGDGVNDGELPNTARYLIGPSSTLAFNAVASRTNTVPIYGTGFLTKAQPSTLALAAYNTSNTAVTVSGGTLAINGGSYMAGSFTVATGAQLAFNGGSGTGATLAVSGSLTTPIKITGGSHQFASPIGQNNLRYEQTGGFCQFIGAQGVSNTNAIFATISGGSMRVAHIGDWPQGLGLLISGNAAVTINDAAGKGQRLASDGRSHTIIITNNATLTADSLQLMSPGNMANTGRLDMAGGVFTVGSINNGNGNDSNRVVVVFNGGLLKLTSSMTIAANPYSVFNVMEGGARINGGSLQNQINQQLVNGTGGADGGLTKYGAHVLVLATNATYAGQTVVKAGTLRTITSNNSAPFGSGSAFINGGILQFYPGGSALAVAQTVANADAGSTVAYGPGPSTLGLSKMSDASMTLTLGNSGAGAGSVLVRTNSGVLAVVPGNGTGASNLGVNEKVLVNGGVGTVNGMVLATIAGIGNDSMKSLDFLTYGGSGLVLPSYTTGVAGGATSLANVSSATATDSAQVYALRVNSGSTLTVNNGQTLTVGDGVNPAGVILNNASSSRAAITNGTLAFGTSEGVIWFNQTPAAGSARVFSTITGTGGLTLVGGGVNEYLTLEAPAGNAYSGPTRIMAGRVNMVHRRGFGDGDVWVYGNESSGGQFLFDFADTLTNAFHFAGVGTTESPSFGALRFNANSKISGPVELMEDTRVSAYTLFSGTFDTPISGLGGLEVMGPESNFPWGQIILKGVNAYMGTTKINNGTLQVAEGGTLGQGPVINNGTLLLACDSDRTVTNVLTGSGRLVKAGAGRLTLTSASAFAGSIQIDAGTVSIGSGATSLAYGVGGVLDLGGSNLSMGRLVGTGVVSTASGEVTLTVGADNSDSQYRGVIANGAGTLGLTKAGQGTLALSGQNTYSGATVVGAGTLKLQALPTLITNNLAYRLDASDASKLTLSDTNVSVWADSSPAGVNFTQSVVALQPVYVTNAINGLAAIRFEGFTNRLGSTKSAAVQTVFAVNRVRGFMGGGGLWGKNGADYGIRQGSLTSWQWPGNDNDFNWGGQIFVNGAETNTFNAGAAHILTSVSGISNNWLTALGDYWAGTGFWRSYKGDVGEVLVYSKSLLSGDRQNIEAYLAYKWLGVGSNAATNVLPTGTALSISNNATLDLNGVSQAVASLSGSGTVANGSGTWATLTAGGDNSSTAFTGVISGSNALTKVGNGTLTLSGANTFLGETRVSGGTLRLSGGDNRLNAASSLAVASGAIFDVNNLSQTLASLGGSGTVKACNGLTVTGAVAPGNAGSIGTLTFEGSPTLTGSYSFTAGTGSSDLLVVQGSLSLSSLALDIEVPEALTGLSYTILQCSGTLSGTFETTDLPRGWTVSYDYAMGTVTLRHQLGTMVLFK